MKYYFVVLSPSDFMDMQQLLSALDETWLLGVLCRTPARVHSFVYILTMGIFCTLYWLFPNQGLFLTGIAAAWPFLLGGQAHWTVGLVATLISMSSIIAADTYAFLGGKVFMHLNLPCCVTIICCIHIWCSEKEWLPYFHTIRF